MQSKTPAITPSIHTCYFRLSSCYVHVGTCMLTVTVSFTALVSYGARIYIRMYNKMCRECFQWSPQLKAWISRLYNKYDYVTMMSAPFVCRVHNYINCAWVHVLAHWRSIDPSISTITKLILIGLYKLTIGSQPHGQQYTDIILYYHYYLEVPVRSTGNSKLTEKQSPGILLHT